MASRAVFFITILLLSITARADDAPPATPPPPSPPRQHVPGAIIPPASPPIELNTLPPMVFPVPAVEAAPAPELPVHQAPFASDVRFPGSLEPLLADLRSPAFEVRDDATQKLLHLPAERLADVREAISQERDPEAAARLTRIAAHLFLKRLTPLDGRSSLLGISLSLEPVRTERNGDLRMSVAVVSLQPGYPAAQDLRVGDRLLAIDGERFPLDMTVDDFRKVVTSRRPGSSVRFTVLREGRQINLPIQVAGLPAADAGGIENVIAERTRALESFLATLHSQVETPVQILEDRSSAMGDDAGDGQPQVRIIIGR